MDMLHMLGEAASIAASAFMAGQVKLVWKRVQADARVPVFFARSGQPGVRANKTVGLCLMPAIAAILLLFISFRFAGAMDSMVFTLQLLAAAGFVAAHTVHLRHVMEILADEGKLDP
jgi:hypothetical protein